MHVICCIARELVQAHCFHFLLQAAKDDPLWIESLERDFTSFVADKGKLRLTLQPMPAAKRELVHEYAEQGFGLTTHSVGQEPNRAVQLYKGNASGVPTHLASFAALLVSQEALDRTKAAATPQNVLRLVDVTPGANLQHYLREWSGEFKLNWEGSTTAVLTFDNPKSWKACSDVLGGGMRGVFRVDRSRNSATAAAAAPATAAAAASTGTGHQGDSATAGGSSSSHASHGHHATAASQTQHGRPGQTGGSSYVDAGSRSSQHNSAYGAATAASVAHNMPQRNTLQQQQQQVVYDWQQPGTSHSTVQQAQSSGQYYPHLVRYPVTAAFGQSSHLGQTGRPGLNYGMAAYHVHPSGLHDYTMTHQQPQMLTQNGQPYHGGGNSNDSYSHAGYRTYAGSSSHGVGNGKASSANWQTITGGRSKGQKSAVASADGMPRLPSDPWADSDAESDDAGATAKQLVHVADNWEESLAVPDDPIRRPALNLEQSNRWQALPQEA